MPPYVKFIGILLIIWAALMYSADGAVKRLFDPLVRLAVPVMRAITRAVSFVLWPVEQLIAMI
jgi:hypothetical protein